MRNKFAFEDVQKREQPKEKAAAIFHQIGQDWGHELPMMKF
jgi:hypothetical protein